MEIVRLSSEMQIPAFDCGDEDLNGFAQLQPLDENKDTRLMYFDMLTLAE